LAQRRARRLLLLLAVMVVRSKRVELVTMVDPMGADDD
jgi:hypothetical protein